MHVVDGRGAAHAVQSRRVGTDGRDEADAAGVARAAHTLLKAVRVLHRRGFEQLRIVPGMSPTGLHWRCTLVPAVATDQPVAARYTTGNGSDYFGTGTTEATSAEELASVIETEFPELVEAARARDLGYVAWFATMLDVAMTGFLPCYYDEDMDPPVDELPLIRLAEAGDPPHLPMPPPPPGAGVVR